MLVDINEAIKILKDGGVIGIPTDTVYGLASLKTNYQKIYDIKKRDADKKLITFVKEGYEFNVDDFTKNLFAKYWPGNTTFIINENDEFVSYRIPNEPNVLNLLMILDDKLVTTSANISGEKPATSAQSFEATFPNIALLEEKRVIKKSNKPSTILKIDNQKIIKIR